MKIHDLDRTDSTAIETELGGPLRAIEFIYKEPGINRPLKPTDNRNENLNKTDYRNQVNKLANAIKEGIVSLTNPVESQNTTHNTSSSSRQKSGLRKSLVFLLLPLLLLLGYFAYDQLSAFGRPEIDKSIAVLPFTDMSPGHDQEYVGDGVADEIISVLGKATDLKVIARTSSFQFKGKNEDLRTIGKSLGVATVLEGSVHKHDDMIRVNVQLIKAADGTQIWTETFNRQSSDLFGIYDQIASAIAAKLKSTLSIEKYQRSTTWNDEALRYYQRARQFYDVSQYDQAIDLFTQSLEADSTQATTYLYLATSLINKGDTIRGKLLVDKALQLNPDFPEALAGKARMQHLRFNFRDAVSNMARALEIDNSNPLVLRTASNLYSSLGWHEEGLRYAKKAVEVDPLQARSVERLASTYYLQRNYSLALKQYQRFKELGGTNHAFYAMLLMHTDRLEEAFNDIELEQSSSARLYTQTILLSKTSPLEAESNLQSYVTRYTDLHFDHAELFSHLGKTEQALDCLEKAFLMKDPLVADFILNSVLLDPIRNQPRFKAVLEKMNFPKPERR